MDELAQAAGADPVQFRLRHLKDPRGRAVIEEVARKSNYSSWKTTEGRGHGLAYARYKNIGAYCAVVAEVEAGPELRGPRRVAPGEVGFPVDPPAGANPIEGGVVHAAGWGARDKWKPGTVR